MKGKSGRRKGEQEKLTLITGKSRSIAVGLLLVLLVPACGLLNCLVFEMGVVEVVRDELVEIDRFET